MKTSRQTSLENFPDPDCPKCGPMGAKKEPKLAFKAFWQNKLVQGAYFGLQGAEQGWNTIEDI